MADIRTHRSGSMMSGVTGFLLGIAFVVAAGFGLMLWGNSNRDAPLRTAELNLPAPALPLPPGTAPDSGQTETNSPAQR